MEKYRCENGCNMGPLMTGETMILWYTEYVTTSAATGTCFHRKSVALRAEDDMRVFCFKVLYTTFSAATNMSETSLTRF